MANDNQLSRSIYHARRWSVGLESVMARYRLSIPAGRTVRSVRHVFRQHTHTHTHTHSLSCENVKHETQPPAFCSRLLVGREKNWIKNLLLVSTRRVWAGELGRVVEVVWVGSIGLGITDCSTDTVHCYRFTA